MYLSGTNRMISPEGNANVDQSACTSETESTISGLPRCTDFTLKLCDADLTNFKLFFQFLAMGPS